MGEGAAQYFQKRARAERDAAAIASSPAVQRIHLELAERYAAEADQCRRDAERYLGQPERQFLLRAACSFDELSADNAQNASTLGR